MNHYEWHQAKREENQTKHGVDFADIEHFDWDTALVERSDRQGESRYTGVGYLRGRLYVVVFTDRNGTTRIISLRRASQEERKKDMLKLTIEEIAASRMTFEEIEADFGEETAIQVGIFRDQDAPELGKDWFIRARPATEVVPGVVEQWRRTRGRQRTPIKESISIRLDQDVVAYYRASGRGWQSRINEALRKYSVDAKPEAAAESESEPQR